MTEIKVVPRDIPALLGRDVFILRKKGSVLKCPRKFLRIMTLLQ